MAFSVLTGDLHELASQAAALGTLATSVDGGRRRLGSVQAARQAAGDNAMTTGITKRADAIEPVLTQAMTDLRKAQDVLLRLREDLLELEHRGKAAQARLDHARADPHTSGLAWMHERAVELCRSDAFSRRAQAGAELEALGRDTPVYRAKHPSWWHRFSGDVKDIAWDTVTGVVDLVTGVGGLTVEALWDHDGAADNWRSLFATSDAILSDPGAAAGSVVQGVVRPDLFKSDPAAWVVNLASLAVGGVLLKGPKTLSAAGKAAKGFDAAKAALGLTGAEAAGVAGRGLIAAGIPTARVSVMPKTARDAIGIGKIWEIDARKRGLALEEGVANALRASEPGTRWLEEVHHNFPTIDLYNERTGVVNSVKSIDPGLTSYQNPAQLKGTLNSYIKQLSDYTPSDKTQKIFPHEVKERRLTLVTPDSGFSDEQIQKLRELHDTWLNAQHPVEIRFVEVPR